MFNKEVYINRRAELKKLVKEGVIVIFGNNESPCNYPGNAYYPFRQDSSFLYYFGRRYYLFGGERNLVLFCICFANGSGFSKSL